MTIKKKLKVEKKRAEKSVGKAAEPRRKLEVKIPDKAVAAIKATAEAFGVDFNGGVNIMLTVNMMRAGQMSRAEYRKGLKEISEKYKISMSKFPPYLKGGDPNEVERFRKFCEKNTPSIGVDPEAYGELATKATKAVLRGKKTITSKKSMKKPAVKTPAAKCRVKAKK